MLGGSYSEVQCWLNPFVVCDHLQILHLYFLKHVLCLPNRYPAPVVPPFFFGR